MAEPWFRRVRRHLPVQRQPPPRPRRRLSTTAGVAATDTFPTMLVEVGFTSNPGTAQASITWFDITAFTRRASIRRGRSSELDDFQAGTCTLVLDNSDRRFDPNHTASPYSPNVLPLRPVRVRARINNITYPLFTGLVTGWPQDYSPPNYAECVVGCVDGFDWFTNELLPSSLWNLEVAADSPRVWYQLGEPSGATTVVDSSGNGAHLAAVGDIATTASLVRFSTESAAKSFDGVNDFAAATVFTWDGAVEFWFSSTATNGVLIHGANHLNDIQISLAGGKLRQDRRNSFPSITARRTETAATFNDGAAHHVVVQIGLTAIIYVDGVSVSVSNSVISMDPVDVQIRLGSAAQFTGFYLGNLDEVAFYQAPLSADRVAAHHNAGTAPWDGDLSGARVARILDQVGWPAADRDIDAGIGTLGPVTLGVSTLTALKDAANDEAGRLYMSVDGKLSFRSRHWPLTNTAVQATWGETDPELPYFFDGFRYAFDRDQIRNHVTGSRTGGATLEAEDTTSQITYRRRSYSVGTLGVRNDNDVRSRLEWTVDHYKDPLLRVDSIVIRPGTTSDGTWTSEQLWSKTLALDIGQRHTIKRSPQGVGSVVTTETLVEGVEHDITPLDWTTRMHLSPADTMTYWVLGTHALDSTTRLAF